MVGKIIVGTTEYILGPLQLAPYGKQLITGTMFAKGKGFLAAAILLRERGGPDHESVVLHLLCQGVEIILKALLLLRDYDTYAPRLERPLGHDLVRLVQEATSAYGINPPRLILKKELEDISYFYSKHRLRYAGLDDILNNPSALPSARIFSRIAAIMRMTHLLSGESEKIGTHFFDPTIFGRSFSNAPSRWYKLVQARLSKVLIYQRFRVADRQFNLCGAGRVEF